MNKSQQAISDVFNTYRDLDYVRGQADCVQFVLDYMEALGLTAPTITYERHERLTAREVIRYLGKPLPEGEEGDVVLSKQMLGLNTKAGYYITMSKDKGGLVLLTLDEVDRRLQWQVAEEDDG